MAHDTGELHLNAPPVKIRFTDIVPPREWEAPEGWTEGDPIILSTSLGAVYFNETLPVDFPYVEGQVGKKRLAPSSTSSPSATTRARWPRPWTR